MTTWTPASRNTSAFSGQARNSSEFIREDNSSIDTLRFLIDDTYRFLTDDTNSLLIQDVIADTFTTQTKS